MYEKALEIDPFHILTLSCYADMLSGKTNPLRAYVCANPYTLNPQPSTLNPNPSNLNPQP